MEQVKVGNQLSLTHIYMVVLFDVMNCILTSLTRASVYRPYVLCTL